MAGGSDPADPAPGDGDPGDTTPVLLEGDPDDRVLDVLEDISTPAAPAEEVVGNLITTRLVAIVNPDTTVGAVNQILSDVGARITYMGPNDPTMELVIPAVASTEEAQALADGLVARGAFWAAFPARTFVPPLQEEPEEVPDGGDSPKERPPSAASSIAGKGTSCGHPIPGRVECRRPGATTGQQGARPRGPTNTIG